MTVWIPRAVWMFGFAVLWSMATNAAPPTESVRPFGARASAQGKQAPAARHKVKMVFVVRGGGTPGGPVHLARVNAYDGSFWASRLMPLRQAETNPEGVATFELDLTSDITVDVEIIHQNFRAHRQSIPVSRKDVEIRHEITLAPGALNDPIAGAPANVTVCATDDSRAPVGDATITIAGRLPSHSRSAVTGADGCAVVPAVYLGRARHAVSAQRAGYEDASSTVDLSPDTRNNPPRVALTMKKQLGRLTAELAITVREPGGAPVPDARVTISGTRNALSTSYEQSTDVEGRTRFVVNEFGTLAVRVTRYDYQDLATSINVPHGTERMPVVLQFVPKPVARSNPVTVTVLSADRRRPVVGARVETDVTVAHTDAQGRATLMMSLSAGDVVTVSVSAEGYRTARQALDTRAGRVATDVQASGTVMLQPGEDPAGPNSPVRLVVQVRDVRNDRAVAGAEVTVRLPGSPDGIGLGRTDAAGDFTYQSSLIRALIGQGLVLDVRKPGFLPRVNELVAAELLALPTTRIFTVSLEPAEIPLIVELKNSVTNERIAGGGARFRFLHENRTVFTEENGYSGMLLIIREAPGVSITRLRSTAMLLEVSHPRIKTKNVIVNADLLKVSLTVPTITVLVDRDWSRLDDDLKEIETRWSRLDSDLQKLVTAQANLAKYEEESLAAQKKTQAILDEIASTTIPVDPNAVAACAQARDAASVIERAEQDAKTLAMQVSMSLTLAERAAATCASVSQADDIVRHHRNALNYAAQLTLAEKVAVASNAELKGLAAVVGAAGGIRAVDALVARFYAEKDVLEELAGKAKKEYDSAFAIRAGVASTHAALVTDFEALKSAWSIQPNADGNHQHAEVLSRDLSQRFDVMAFRLRRASAPDLDGGAAERIQGRINDLYRQYFSVSESAARKVAACPVTPRDREVEAISEILFNVTFALGLASDLPARAETCRKADACDRINLDVTSLLEKGDVRGAEAAVTRARGGKCDLKAAEDMIALVKAVPMCRFQEAVDVGARLPVSIRQQAFISNRLFDARRGQGNEKEVDLRLAAARQLMTQAETAQQASRCDDASRLWRDAEDQLANAEAYTSGIACLKPRIDAVRADLNAKRSPCGSMPRTPPPVPPTTPPPGPPPTTPPTGPPPSGPPTTPTAPPTTPTGPPTTPTAPPTAPTAPPSRPAPGRGAPPVDKVPEVLGPTGGRGAAPPPAPPPPPRVLTASLDCGPSLELRPGRLSKNCDVIVQGWRTDTANPVRVQVRMSPPETGVEATPGNTSSDPGSMNSTSASDYASRYVFQQGFWASARASAGTRVDAEVIVSQDGHGRVVLPLRLNVIAANALDGSSERPVGDIRRGTGGAMCVFRYKSFGDKPECFSFVAASCANSRYADPQYERIAESMTSAQAGAVVDQYSRYFDDAYQCRVPSGTPQYSPVPPAVVQQGTGGDLCVWRYKLTGDAPQCFHVAIAQCGRYGPPYELIGQNMGRGEAGTRADQISRYFNDELGCRAGLPPRRKDPPQTTTPPDAPPTPPSTPPPPPPPPDPPRPARTLSRFGISPRDVTVQPGQSVDLRASGVWSDAPSQVVDLTGQVRWSPSSRVVTTPADAGRRIVVTATHAMGTDSITITVASPAPPPDPNTGPPPPPDVAARMKAAAGTWYTGSKDQCWTTTISVSGDSLTGSWTLAGPFTDSASFKVTYKNGGFSGDYSGSYNNPGCISCNKGTSGTRVGTITVSFTDTTLTTRTVENEKSGIWSAGRSFSGTATRTPCKSPTPEARKGSSAPLLFIGRSAPRRRLDEGGFGLPESS